MDSNGIWLSSLPENYIRPESDRPRLSDVPDCDDVPVIDLGSPDRTQIIRQINEACRFYGFFQVINHGVSLELMKKMLEMARDFFDLPLEEKLKFYPDDHPMKTLKLSKETVHSWRDFIRLLCYPLEDYVQEWPSNPSSFKEVVSTYCKEVRQLGFRLLQPISESLGLEGEYIEKVLGEQEQRMTVNYYPPCPQPELTYGLPGHTDPNAFTIILQDQQVAGLQVFKDGKWVAVNPCPNAFVINIGDQLQALSNGRYKSIWHRAIVNSEKARISVVSFLCPAYDAIISPADGLTDGDGSPAIYRSFTYMEYWKKYLSRNWDREHCLELFKK